jgi:hypothetical protein
MALLMQVLVPQGFMFSGNPAEPGLVICTGHGPLIVTADPGWPTQAPKPPQDKPCPFAAHLPASAPPSGPSVATIAFFAATFVGARAFDVAPGRGLAAPPPPSHAPPTLA